MIVDEGDLRSVRAWAASIAASHKDCEAERARVRRIKRARPITRGEARGWLLVIAIPAFIAWFVFMGGLA